MTPLYGHVSEETAYLVADYPYGRKVRCRIRYWLESDEKRGFRFCSQTEHPTKFIWNAPKKSTYMLLAGCMFLDEKGHTQWEGLSEYSKVGEVESFITKYPMADLSRLQDWCRMKKVYCQQSAEGKRKWTINGVVQEDTPEEIEINRREGEQWSHCSSLLKKE